MCVWKPAHLHCHVLPAQVVSVQRYIHIVHVEAFMHIAVYS